MAAAKKKIARVVARVTMERPGSWTAAGRARIAKWLRSRAYWLEKHGHLANGASQFRQTYYA